LPSPRHDSGPVWVATAFTVRDFHPLPLASYWRFRNKDYVITFWTLPSSRYEGPLCALLPLMTKPMMRNRIDAL
jgi:hypothetical protein